MKQQKKPLPVFELLFDARNIVPESIPLGMLTQALSAIRRLASGTQSSEEEAEEEFSIEEASGSIRLLNMKRGSAVYQFVCPKDDRAVGFLRGAGKVLENPEDIGDRDYILSPIDRLSAAARRLGCRIILREAGKEDGVLAKIESDSYDRLSEKLFIKGDTSFVGKVERVGGATSMRCALRVPFQQRLLYCSVESPEVSRQLGEHLYREVVVHGEARWIKHTWKLVSFKARSVTRLQKKRLSDAFQELRDAGGKDWDEIADPKQHLEEVCGA